MKEGILRGEYHLVVNAADISLKTTGKKVEIKYYNAKDMIS